MARSPFHVSHVQSYTSSPSIGYDRDNIEDTQVMWMIDIMSDSPQQHVLQRILMPTVVPLSIVSSPLQIVAFPFPSALPYPLDPANVVFLPLMGSVTVLLLFFDISPSW